MVAHSIQHAVLKGNGNGDGCTLRRRQTVVKIQCEFGNEGHLRTMIHNMLWFVFQKRKR